MLRPKAVGPEQSGKPYGFLSGHRPFTWRGLTFLRSWYWPWARPVQGPPVLDLSVVAVGGGRHHPGHLRWNSSAPGRRRPSLGPGTGNLVLCQFVQLPMGSVN